MTIRRGVALFRGQREFHLDLIGRRRWWFLLSGGLILLALLGLLVRGLNLSIDFEGGAQLSFDNPTGASTEEFRETLQELDREDAVIQIVEGDRVSVRTQSLGDDRREVLEALADRAGIQPSQISVEDIGPRWGAQISRKALQGLIIFLIVASIYISLRFEWKMAASGLVALFHDLIITAGVYALVGREVTPETVIAILTIMGYSLYDTVVIFDKVKENADSLALVSRETYSGVVNMSLNQVLMRSVNTSLTSLLPIGALMWFGGETLKDFAFALFVGVLAGTYSSIFVAAPILAVLKEREPRLAQIRERATRRVSRGPEPAPAPRVEEPELTPVAAPARTTPTGTGVRRRPKKKPRSKRRRR